MASSPVGPHLLFADGVAVFIGHIGDTSAHQHYAIQICLGVEGPVAITHAEGTLEAAAVLVPGSAMHQLGARGTNVMLLYYEPTGVMGEALGTRYPAVTDVSAVWADRGATLRALVAGGCVADDVHAVRSEIEAALAPDVVARPVRDRRVRRVLEELDRESETEPDVDTLAELAGLSPSRLRHLFREQMGIPIRSYRLWARIRRAVELIPDARSITEVAHAAGFSDSAHLSRAFRQLFGVTPSDLLTR